MISENKQCATKIEKEKRNSFKLCVFIVMPYSPHSKQGNISFPCVSATVNLDMVLIRNILKMCDR